MTEKDNDITGDQLFIALHYTTPKYNPVPHQEEYPVDCDKVYPSVYIGDGAAAKDKDYLKKLGITHIVNAAEGKDSGMVDTGKNFYIDTLIEYFGIEMTDDETTNITEYFEEVSDFIDSGVRSGGKVFVHCLKGKSRSSTLVLAYLMIKKKFTATDAIKKVREARLVRPNWGFLQQLADLDNRLRKERSRTVS